MQTRHAPVPENDRLTQRCREEGATLIALVEKDKLLVGQAETLRALVADKTSDAILVAVAEIEAGVAAIGQTLANRRIMTI